MKSKKAEEYINTHPLFMAKIFAKNAIELAEQEAEEEINHYKTALEQSKQREELAWRIVSDKRSEIEALKARAVRVHVELCSHGKSSDCGVKLCTECGRTNYFIQKLNEQ